MAIHHEALALLVLRDLSAAPDTGNYQILLLQLRV
jgi:hypothetical protein